MKSKKINLIINMLFLCLIMFVLYKWFIDYNMNKEIQTSGMTTTGTIVKHYIVFPESHYIIYTYAVDGKKYSRKENNSRITKYCKKDPSECIGSHFTIRYSIHDHQKALIVLDSIIN